jgi:hypothetical protein
MSYHEAMIEATASGVEQSERPTLTVGIPAGRSIDWTTGILLELKGSDSNVTVLVARWSEDPLSDQELEGLNAFFSTQQVLSEARHAPAMRNAIVRETTSTHILFLDDDMVPRQNLLASAMGLAATGPDIVYQGFPFRVANADNWFARNEGKLYERGYQKYVDEQNNVSLLDARLMLVPTEALRQTPFDESLVFGGGEGRELAKHLLEKGVVLQLTGELDAAHINRGTLAAAVQQKWAHGRARGQELVQHGPGERGWARYFASYAMRHYLGPALQATTGKLEAEELLYVWSSNTVLWTAAFEYMLRPSLRSQAKNREHS